MAQLENEPVVPVPAAHRYVTLPVALDKAAVDAAMMALQHSLFMKPGMSSVQIEADVFNVPNADSLDLKVSWKEALDAAGKNQWRALTADEAAEAKRFGGASQTRDGVWSEEVKVNGEADVITKVNGDAAVAIGTAFDRVDLECAAPGKKSTLGKVTVTLLKCKGQFFQVRFDGVDPKARALAGFQVAPVDRDGKGLTLETSASEPLFAGEKKMADISYADFKKGPLNIFVLQAVAAAPFTKIAVLTQRSTETRAFKVSAAREPKEADAIVGARFVPYHGGDPVFADVPAARWKSETVVKGGRSSAMMGFNQPRFYVRLPATDAAAFATLETTKVTPKLKKKSKFEVADNGYEETQHRQAYTVSSPDDKPLAASKISGMVKVHYPLQVVLTTLTAAKPASDGVSASFDKNHVSIKLAGGEIPNHPSFAAASYEPVRAFDGAGRELRLLPFQSSDGDATVYAFWGTPASVRVITVSGWGDVSVPFSVDVPPPLPKDKSGDPGDN